VVGGRGVPQLRSEAFSEVVSAPPPFLVRSGSIITAIALLGATSAERHAPEPRPVRAVLDRAPPVDRRRAVGRDVELRQERLAKIVLRGESPQRHATIMDSVRTCRYSPARPEPL